MTLCEAIEEVKRYCGEKPVWADRDVHDSHQKHTISAIATILNAVVKGEIHA